MAEIHQGNCEFEQAATLYGELIKEQPVENVFLKEKTFMRFAECCYRLNKPFEGVECLEILEKQMKPV